MNKNDWDLKFSFVDQLFAGKSLWFAAKLHITQAVWCTVNTSLYGSPLYNLLKRCPLIFILIRESPSVFSLTLAAWGRKGSVFSCVFPLSHAHTHSHIKFHCADAEEARFAVSAFPWAKPLCRCPQKRGDENRKLLWSKHLLCYFSAAVAAGAHMVPAPGVNHVSDTDEYIFHIRLD